MKTYLVVTITCPDRPGVVERITELVLNHAANWEDSRMARLGGDFAGIILISVDGDRAEALTQALRQLADDSTTVAVKATQDAPAAPTAPHALVKLSLTGADHEGIVHKVSAYLASQGINVESMDTHVSAAPMSASPLFHMDAVVKVPGSLRLEELAQNLDAIADDLGVGIAITPHEGD